MIADISPPDVLAYNVEDVVVSYSFDRYDCVLKDDEDSVDIFVPVTPKTVHVKTSHDWETYVISDNFWDIIKNQVHIFPSLYIDFGLVLSQREVGYYIWNSWTDKSVFILEPVAIGDYGTTFVVDIAGNFTLQAGKGTPAVLTVYTEGPISSSTDFDITTTVQGMSSYTYKIRTLATRVVVFPFLADWSKKVEFKLKFNTIISKSTQGFEQRRPLLSKPQRTVSFSHNDFIYGLVSNAVNFAQDKSVGIPIVHEQFHLSSIDSDKMGVTLIENTSHLWNLKRYCNYVLFYEKSTNILVAKKITSFTENKVFLENPILETFSNVSGVVCFPMIIGIFNSIKPTVLSGDMIGWDLSFSELIGENQPDLANVPALPSALNNKFDWENKIDFEQNLYRDIGEFPGTAQFIYSKLPYNKNYPKSYTGTFVFKSRSELCSFLDFMCGAKGRFKKFEYLWPLNEFKLVRGEYEGVNQLRVRNNYYGEQFYKILNKKIVVNYRNYSLSTSVVSISAGVEYTTLTLANPTNFRIYDEDCDRVKIQQYKTVRFDLDEFTIECHSGTIFSVNVRFMEVYE